MARPRKIAFSVTAAVATALALSACGSQGIGVAKSSPYYPGALLFSQHCSGCHTLGIVGAEGSATSVPNRLRTQAPNFNFRHETVSTVYYAIENGGFSGQIMPKNIVVGPDRTLIAEFLAQYAGADAQTSTKSQ